jgi:soluble lytic murein transglycosylase-like protein
MGKKLFLAGALVAALFSANPSCNSYQEKPAESRLERTIDENNDSIRLYNIQVQCEEKELLKKDKIYQMINSSYKEIEQEIPKYITKKFVRTLIRVESGDNPNIVSPAWARGLGQITKEAWYEVEKENYFKNVFIPEKNVKVTIKYLLYLDEFCRTSHENWNNLSSKEKISLISAAYNGGPYRLKNLNWDISEMPDETKAYVPKIFEISKEFIPSEEICQPVF